MDLLERLTQTDGVSGREQQIRGVISNEILHYVDEVYTDALGNLIAHKKGTGKKLLFAAHMDEIGVIVTFIDDNGFLRFSNVGGIYKEHLLYRKVRFENGVIGVIGSEEENKEHKLARMYIDIGANSREEAEQVVSIGDAAAFIGGLRQMNNKVVSKALDNRIGCYALIKAAQELQSENELYFCFTVQEEVGLRGAKTIAHDIEPDFALAVDVTDTGDTPKAPEMAVSLGKGAAIKVMDRSILCDVQVRTTLIELAKKQKIPYQLEVMTDGGTDAGAISLTRSGIRTGGVSIPCRYIHSSAELVDLEDANHVIQLLRAFALQ